MISIVVDKASHDPYQVEEYHPVEVAAEVVVGVNHHFLIHILAPPLIPSVPLLDCTPVEVASYLVAAVVVTVILHDQHHVPYLDQQ